MNKKLKLWDATMLVMGSMIGSGIFIVSADMMRNLGSGYWLIAVWVITGIMTVAAALSYGELSAMFPKAGGQYTYITEIFGKKLGFLYGWGTVSYTHLDVYKRQALKRYIPDGTEADGQKCSNCGSDQVVYQEGCLICKNCGNSKCG